MFPNSENTLVTANKTALDALVNLEERVTRLGLLMEAFDGLAGDNPPSWLPVVWQKVREIEVALESVSTLGRLQS